MIVILTIATAGWSGFTTTIGSTKFPLVVLFIIAGTAVAIMPNCFHLLLSGFLLSIGLFFIIRKTKPHWIVQSFLGLGAFIMSIAWLNIEANEVVSLLEAFGLAFSIDTG